MTADNRPPRSRTATGIRRPPVLWRAVTAIDKFIRLHFLSFTAWLVLLGAASVSPRVSLAQLAGLLGVAFCFHVYSYVLNDVVDLPVDRGEPSRAADPLVTGAIRPWQALTVALGQIPLAVLLNLWLGGGWPGLGVLAAGFALMAVYNLWGKRCFLPPLTDAAQGVAWGCLALYGAVIVPGSWTFLTFFVFAYGAGFIILINGIHGGLRDLVNDLAKGRRTTSIFFGARPDEILGIRIPAAEKVFSWAVQIGLVGLTLIPLVRNDFGYGKINWWLMLAVALALGAINLYYLARVFQPRNPTWELAFRIHMFFLLAAPVALFLPYLEPALAAVVVALFLLPTVCFEATHDLFRRVFFRNRLTSP